MAIKEEKQKKKRISKPVTETKRKKRADRIRLIRNIFVVIVVIALVLGVVFALFNRNDENVSIVENGLGSLTAIVQNGAANAARTIRDTAVDLTHYSEIKNQITELEQENDTLRIRLQNTEELQQENTRLMTLLEARTNYTTLDPVYAKVIARTPGAWFDTFSINRGTNNGVSVGMAVITADGLVGRIYEAGLNYAKVLSIIDPRSRVATLIERTRDNGIMRGEVTSASDTAECFVYYLPNINSIISGDTIITSGMDTLYPKGIPVGVVTEVSHENRMTDQYVVVQPFVDFQHIEEVLVLRQAVETDKDSTLTAVPTPTPVPLITPTPGPAGENSTAVDPNAGGEDVWMRPTVMPDGGFATLEPIATLEPVNRAVPEDIWANN